jgi:hypothetical protein
MQESSITRAADLIEQREKIRNFLRERPSGTDTLTITFRKGSASKSVTLKHKPTLIDIETMVVDLETNITTELNKMGVEPDQVG